MSKETDFLLGRTFGVLTQTRAYLIQKQDEDGLRIIEDEYQEILAAVDRLFYNPTEKKQ